MIYQQDTELESQASPADELPVEAQEIRLLVFMLHKAIIRDLNRRLEASGADISGPQYGVLRLLSDDNATISELSGRMLLAPATLVHIVDTLERKGLVQRSSDPNDRRRIPLVLTESGSAVLKGMLRVNDQDSLVRALTKLGRERTGLLHELLHEFVGHMVGDDALAEHTFVTAWREQIRADE